MKKKYECPSCTLHSVALGLNVMSPVIDGNPTVENPGDNEHGGESETGGFGSSLEHESDIWN